MSQGAGPFRATIGRMSSSLRASMLTGFGEIPPTSTLWGTFEDPTLERDFEREDFALGVKRFVRFSVTMSVLAFLAYGIHDALVIPEVRSTAWAIRFLGFGPVAALLVLFVFKNERSARHQPAMLLFGLAVNVVVIWIGAISSPTGFFLYTAYSVVFVTVGPFLARMSMKTQVLFTALTLVVYNVFDARVAHAAPAPQPARGPLTPRRRQTKPETLRASGTRPAPRSPSRSSSRRSAARA